MRNLYEVIHSPTALLAFEAAARLSSFTRAASELNVSQPAISLSVKKLESALGTPLFERRNRAIRLTEAGERFYTDVSFGLMHILRSAQGISHRTKSRHVTLSCSTAFAQYWLVPRFAHFHRERPDINLRIQTTDRDQDIANDGTTLAVWRGPNERAGYELQRIAGERIFAIASPDFLSRNEIAKPSDLSLGDLAELTLLHLDEPYRLRPDWKDWFAHNGEVYDDRGGGLRFNDYALVIQAALAGQGVAMGWEHVTRKLITEGRLARLTAHEYSIGYGFFACWPSGTKLDEDTRAVVDWLRQEHMK